MINRRILVISRSPALSRAIQASLGPGYQVVTSSNVIDVEEEVREQGPFDILVAGPVFDSHAGMARLASLRADLRRAGGGPGPGAEAQSEPW